MGNELGKLWVIATPIGNREDITLRAMSLLEKLEVFYVEDTREFQKLLGLYGISRQGKKIHSLGKHNLQMAVRNALETLEQGQEVGLVCDRGTPALSDPGAELVRGARELGGVVIPVPGASSVTTLWSVSGISQTPFLFLGFLPEKAKDRVELFDRIKITGMPVCFFEAPTRIRETLAEIKTRFIQGEIVVGREMTKVYEEYRVDSLERLDPRAYPEKGEYVVILSLERGEIETPQTLDDEIGLRLCSEREWSKKVAHRLSNQRKISAKEVYNGLQRAKSKDEETFTIDR